MDNGLSKFLFERMGVPSFRNYLNLSSFRHKLISGNIANVATPGYKAESINFQDEYARLEKKTNHIAGTLTDPNHIPLGSHPSKPPDVNEAKVKDGDINSVDIEQEASTLAQNELLFSIGAKLLQRRFESTRNAIKSQ